MWLIWKKLNKTLPECLITSVSRWIFIVFTPCLLWKQWLQTHCDEAGGSCPFLYEMVIASWPQICLCLLCLFFWSKSGSLGHGGDKRLACWMTLRIPSNLLGDLPPLAPWQGERSVFLLRGPRSSEQTQTSLSAFRAPAQEQVRFINLWETSRSQARAATTILQTFSGSSRIWRKNSTVGVMFDDQWDWLAAVHSVLHPEWLTMFCVSQV